MYGRELGAPMSSSMPALDQPDWTSRSAPGRPMSHSMTTTTASTSTFNSTWRSPSSQTTVPSMVLDNPSYLQVQTVADAARAVEQLRNSPDVASNVLSFNFALHLWLDGPIITASQLLELCALLPNVRRVFCRSLRPDPQMDVQAFASTVRERSKALENVEELLLGEWVPFDRWQFR